MQLETISKQHLKQTLIRLDMAGLHTNPTDLFTDVFKICSSSKYANSYTYRHAYIQMVDFKTGIK